MLFEKFGPKPLGVYPPRAGGQKTLFWNRRRILTENIYATKHDINHRKETRQSTETPLPRTSCRLTFVIHFGLIIFARWSLCSSQMPRAWIALVRLRAGRAHAGLCHASSCFYFFFAYFYNIYAKSGQQDERKLSLAACHCTFIWQINYLSPLLTKKN